MAGKKGTKPKRKAAAQSKTSKGRASKRKNPTATNNAGKSRRNTPGKAIAVTDSTQNIHDSFFKAFMMIPEFGARFLQERLPKELADLMVPDQLKILPSSFVDQSLDQTHLDLLVEVPLKTGDSLLVHFVLEHKSSPQRFVRLQLAGYVIDVLKDWHRRHPGEACPAVISALIYNGRRRWNFPTELAELTNPQPPVIRSRMLSLDHILVSLQTIADEDLSKSPELRAMLLVFKHGTTPNYLLVHLEEIITQATPVLPELARPYYFSYIGRLIGFGKLEATLTQVMPDAAKEFMDLALKPVKDESKAEGLAEGLAKGEAKGEAKGLAHAVLEVVQHDFFKHEPVSDALRERIAAANAATLQTWLKQLLRATSLKEVFGEDLEDAPEAAVRETAAKDALAKAVLQVAQKRFATVPGWVRKRLASATEAMLESWLVQLIDAKSIEAVFGDRAQTA